MTKGFKLKINIKSSYPYFKFIFVIFILFIAKDCFGDWWHNNSFLMGGKASGMGGAFTAISEGAPGLYYNPAGMTYSPDAGVSVSTTNYYTSIITQDGYLGKDNSSFSLTDADLLSGFFGGVFRTGLDLPTYIAFAIYNKDYVNIDNVIDSHSIDGLTHTQFVQKLSSTENEYALGAAFRV